MLKRSISIILAFVLLVTATSCRSADVGSDSPYAVSLEKGVLNTEIEFPRNFATTADVEPEGSANDPFQITDVAKTAGLSDVVTNGDGSVTIKLKTSELQGFLTQVKIAIDEYLNAFIDENKDTCSFRSSSHDIKFTEFDILVNENDYDEEDILSTMPFYCLGMLYQFLDGNIADDISTTVNIQDKDSEALLHTDSLTFDDYVSVISGEEELSTEKQQVTTTGTSAATATSTTTATTKATTATTASTTTAATSATTTSVTTATTAATTTATTATTANTTATTAVTTATTTATTAATTAQSNRDLPTGNYSDTGAGTLRIANPSDDDSEGSTSITLSGSAVRLLAEDFDITHYSYIYIDGMLAATVKLASAQDLQLEGSYISSGTHKVEVLQYAGDNQNAQMITYKTVSYTVN